MNPTEYIEATIGLEGGYSNHAADKGGETMWGITAATARAYGYTGPMAQMTRETAVQIYLARYWTQPRLDQVRAIDADIAGKLFDVGVNMGPATGVRFLQRALNVLNKQAASFVDITVDGGIGPMTLLAMQSFIDQRGGDGRSVLLGMVAAQQSVRYVEIAEKDSSQETFQYGWQRNRALGMGG
jgi:lysozyme family protein